VKQKSLQRPPTIRFTDSVLRTRFLIIILRFGGGVGGGGGGGGGGGCGGGGGDFNISLNSKICPSGAPRNYFGLERSGVAKTFFGLERSSKYFF